MARISSFTLALLLTADVSISPAYAQQGGGGHVGGGDNASGIGASGHAVSMGLPHSMMPHQGMLPPRGVAPPQTFVPGRAVPGRVRAAPLSHSYSYAYRNAYPYGYGSYAYPDSSPTTIFPDCSATALSDSVGVPVPSDDALSFGISLSYAYPNAYPYGYDSYAYPDSSPTRTFPDYSSTALSDSVAVTTLSYGALSFDITPSSAVIWVDGFQVGAAAAFGSIRGPLELTPGRHAVEIQLSGYRTIAFEVEVVPGQVLPVRSTMQHEYYY